MITMRSAILSILFAALAPLGVMTSVLQENKILDNVGPIRTTWNWENCTNGDESYGVDVTSIEISPDPPQKGEELNVTVSGIVKEVIEEGAYAYVKAKIGRIEILNKEYDICDEARNSDSEIQCPVPEGDYTISQTAQLPKLIPPRKYRVTVEGYTFDDAPLLCVNIDVDFGIKFRDMMSIGL